MILESIHPTLDFEEGLKNSDIVIECVYEKVDIKQNVLKRWKNMPRNMRYWLLIPLV